jgi:hypothetical protein
MHTAAPWPRRAGSAVMPLALQLDRRALDDAVAAILAAHHPQHVTALGTHHIDRAVGRVGGDHARGRRRQRRPVIALARRLQVHRRVELGGERLHELALAGKRGGPELSGAGRQLVPQPLGRAGEPALRQSKTTGAESSWRTNQSAILTSTVSPR